ncbi:hypothetical protein [Lederbergia sp. NSJ-179]|nr:hypothetical protein [Lederbergia sp. NSJ-179]
MGQNGVATGRRALSRFSYSKALALFLSALIHLVTGTEDLK